MEKNKVSVVIPVYNAGNGKQFLQRQIESVLSQRYGTLEIILVNDGSTDDSLDICNYYMERDKRIKIINKKNGGESTARNAGIDAATGDYISIIDQDDIIDINMYEDMMHYADLYHPDIIRCNFEVISGNTKKDVIVDQPYEILLDRSFLENNVFPYMIGIQNNETKMIRGHWTMVANLEMINKYNIRYCEELLKENDHRFLVNAFAYAQKVIFIKETYYHWIKRNGSNTSSYSPRFWNILSNFKLYEELFGNLYDFRCQDKIKYNVRAALIDALEYILIHYRDCNAKKEIIRILRDDEVGIWMKILMPETKFERHLKKDVLEGEYDRGYRHSVEHYFMM